MSKVAPWIAFVAVALVASQAFAEDVLRSKGDTLRGTLVSIDSGGVEFDLVQGEGSIRVPWAEVEDLVTEQSFFVMHGDEAETNGRIVGFDAEQGVALEGGRQIAADTIYRGYGTGEDGLSDYEKLRSRLRYWKASLDAGTLFVRANTDRIAGFVGLRVERNKSPTRLLLEAAARYAAQEESGRDQEATEDHYWGLLRGEYDTSDRTYTYASTRASYDGIQHLSLRLEPRVGVGVRVWESERFNFSTDIGGAWIYEDYFGRSGTFPNTMRRGTDDYWAIAFGAAADAKLPYGVIWRARGEYIPAVDEWGRDYLLRGETELEFPLLEWLSLKAVVADEFDKTPAEDSVRNRFTTTLALSLRF